MTGSPPVSEKTKSKKESNNPTLTWVTGYMIQILINHLINIFPRYSKWIYAKVYATRTWISIRVVQDRDTLIEQSANYSNRTFTGTCSWFCYGISPNLLAPIHTMKCIGLFKALICMAILNSGTQFPLKMLSDSILYCSNFKIFHFQHYYSNMHLFSVVQL